MKKLKYLKIVILVIICAGLVVGYYYYLSNRTPSDSEAKTEESNLTDAEEILLDDLEADYPPTPREVVKYYNRIITCYYSGECTQEQIEGLAQVQRQLMDNELLEQNPWEDFLASVQADILTYETNETTIADSTVCASKDIEYAQVDGRECAYVTTEYLLRVGTGSSKVNQEYVLREDEEGNWKIVAFQLADDEEE